MGITDTGGLASADLWDVSTSWSSASVGEVDTGGSLGMLLREVDFEEPEEQRSVLTEPAAPGEGLRLRDLMSQDPFFRRLVEQGFDDLDAGRFGPL